MTEAERLERRIRLCEAMGYTDIAESYYRQDCEGKSPDGRGVVWVPDFDNDAEAREQLLEWAHEQGWSVLSAKTWDDEEDEDLIRERPAVKIEPQQGKDFRVVFFADTYAEALVSAIYAAVKAR